ncbi:MAG: hypothetical protein J7L07_08600 [Candidatus Odinarchaeota archaeon]|nr:hypothetical protein [Candidatus Odinarchaeota archaeon]
MKVIIEHFPPLSKWLYLEYKHSSKIVGKNNIIFTNVKRAPERRKLAELGTVREESITVIKDDFPCLVVMDPQAKRTLTTEDFEKCAFYVIGGILGDYPPRGRTYELITSKLNTESRNLGPKQMSIDIAIFVMKMIELGASIEDIEFADELEIQFNEVESVVLPFAYPIIKGKVIITPGLIEYLRRSKY